MKIKNVITLLDDLAPLYYAESYDNVGLLVGDAEADLTGILITHDTLPEVVDEAVEKGANFIVSFHPIIFSGLKKITGKSYIERSIIKAIKNDVAIFAIHTALDVNWNGVNDIILKKLNAVINKSILIPSANTIKKLSTYVPVNYTDDVLKLLFKAGAGSIGNYTDCSFSTNGKGTYKGNEFSDPVIGEKGILNIEDETNIIVTFPAHKQGDVLRALLKSHPYEEVAYEIITLENNNQHIGLGMVGELEEEVDEVEFLTFLKQALPTKCIRHSKLLGKKIKRIAVLGGSGSSATKNAISAGADIFISADFKYHDFYGAEDKLIIADIGHFESEQFIKDLLFEHLSKKITKFAVNLSEINSNPINYF